ncbi:MULTISPECIES: hypothetical protein [unclassified Microbacterium]|uniref:phage tail tube protein n=1 Tax=unclassified Microbacterium TaxID=2609290 RepID=UPI00386BA541
MADATKVKTVVGGMLYLAPTGTALPTSAVSTLPGAYKDMGYWAEDGSTLTPVPGDTVEIIAHTGATVISRQKKGNVTAEFPFIETTKDTFEAYWDTTVAPDGSFEISGGSANKEYVMVYDRLYSDDTNDRFVAERAKITDRAGQANSEGDALQYGMTFGTLEPAGGGAHIIGWAPEFATE